MPRSYLVKIYLRMVAFALLLCFACALLFQGFNGIRQQMWLESHARPLLHWLAGSAEAAAHYPWLAAGYNIQVGPESALVSSAVIGERLGYGQVVAKTSDLGHRVMIRRGDGQILSLDLAHPYADVARASALILRWHLDIAPPAQRQETLRHISSALAVNGRFADRVEQLPPAGVIQQLVHNDLVMYTAERSETQKIALRLGSGELVILASPQPFNAWSVAIALPLLAFAAAALALALCWVARLWGGRLSKVESAALRITRGDLAARLEADSSQPQQRLTRAFNSMAEHIERLVQIQHDMIHAVSHELRTPVARIRFGVQMLADSTDPKSANQQVQDIDGDIQELDELIDEILTYARLEQSELMFRMQLTSVPDLARQVISQQQLLYPDTVMELDIDDASEACSLAQVEPRYLHRAIQNLVGNAARYANHTLRVRCRLDNDSCRIDVDDDGPGIPRADWDNVFIAFSRLDDSRTRTSGGYGLGLSIVRRILYWHGGQAFVGTSTALGGACFSLVWPRVQMRSDDPRPPAPAPAHPH